MKITKSEYEIIRKWIYRNARPLDLTRWQYHFENGKKESVLSALSVYQNEDGGFGYALEADSWNPNSSPIQTCTAVELLKEIDYYDRNHPIIKGILNYLENGKDFHNGYWLAEIPSNNEYPHAPWWTYGENAVDEWGYNPTAVFLGFILYFADKESKLYQEAFKSAADMIEKVLIKEITNMHEISCFISFVEFYKKADVLIKNADALDAKLKKAVNTSINPNTKEWAETYTCKPSNYLNSRSNIYYEDNKELAEYECSFLYEARNSEGVWNITWSWDREYDREFAISENWWKSNLIILNMLYLRNFNQLSI